MTAEHKAKLSALVECGDVYGLMLESVGLWLTDYHPEVESVALVGAVAGHGRPDAVIPITLPRPSPTQNLPPS